MTLSKKAVLSLLVPFVSALQTDPMRMAEPRIGDGSLCHIFQGFGRTPCLAPEGDPPGTGGEKKTFTAEEHQAELDKVVGKRVADATKKFADYEDVKKKAGEVETLKTQLEELNAKLETAGKTQAEIEKINSEKAAKQIEKERTESGNKLKATETERDGWRNKFLDREVADQLGRGLDAAKVLGGARSDAIAALKSIAAIEKDDDGKITSITYEGIAYDSVDKAAVAFLKNKPFFASNGGASGGGTKQPGGNGGGGAAPAGGNLWERSDDELLNMDAQRRAAAR